MTGRRRTIARRPMPERLIPVLLVSALLGGCASGGNGAASPSGASLPGFAAATPAPDFSLHDQFGHADRLADFRGQVVLLTFIDTHCTTVCPLTSELMRRAQQLVGGQPPVQLLAINANPKATSVADTLRWSRRHRMTHRWLFLTAPASELKTVWASYGIHAEMMNGDVVHTAAVFVIDPGGVIRTVFPIGEQSGIGAEAETLAAAVRQIAAAPS